jgi:hypothetical protein
METKFFTFVNSVGAVAALAILFAIPCRAQQAQEVSDRYAHAALKALHAIQTGESNASDVQISAELDAIDAAQSAAATDAERQFSATLYQVYRLKVRDDGVIAAYRRVIEIENSTDDSDNTKIRESKDYAASELTDTLTEIQTREDRCFGELEKSLNQRSLRGLPSCSASMQ